MSKPEENNQLIECVPNFSEGQNKYVIDQIASEVKSVAGVKLLNVDIGKAANRTVLTFAGAPAAVCEAAFRAVKKAAQLIDMRSQKGTHPRIGACDVLPLVPLAHISIDEVAQYARSLGERIGSELQIPVYCYEHAAFSVRRQNLANCRSGEYEGLAQKMATSKWKPDFGPGEFTDSVARTGATIVGARSFLIAYNVNLETDSVLIAQKIACELREKGCRKRKNGMPIGDFVPGKFKKVKAIGWFIDDYGIAQVSFNLVDFTCTSMHHVFEAVVCSAQKYGVRVSGSELIGLVPLKAMTDAGKYFLEKQNLPSNVPESHLVDAAIQFLKLDDLAPFYPADRIIEYRMGE